MTSAFGSIMRRAAAPLMLAVPLAAHAQSGGFVVRLGTDTTAVERYARRGARIEGTILSRSPTTRLLNYVLALNADGTVASFEQATVRPDGTPLPGQPTGLRMTFDGDSVTRESTANAQPNTRRTAVPKGTLPQVAGSYLYYELVIAQAKRDGSGGANVIGFGAQQNAPAKLQVRFFSDDSAEVVSGPFPIGFRLDRTGKVIRADGSRTTAKVIVTAAPDPDIGAMAVAWAAKDATGQAMGAASTRDTLRAMVGGASIWIDYGRPAKRGREIWGKLVPMDTVWRFGANAATQFRTDRDLDIGGFAVSAGLYTLWMLPSAERSLLVVNKQTGQWGTDYNAAQDLVRIPLERRTGLPEPLERFTISVVGGMLTFDWDNVGYGVTVREK